MSDKYDEVDPKLIERFDKVIEGTLSDSDADLLRREIKDSPSVRRAYLEYMNLHASLHWHNVSVNDEDNRDFVSCAGTISSPVDASRPRTGRVRGMMSNAALAAMLLVTVIAIGGSWYGWRLNQDPAVIATLAATRSCSWGDGTLPTSTGSDLAAGQLTLRSGLAEIRFESGAIVSLEGPAKIELIDAMSCVLRQGTLVADVPPSAEGFRVDTERAAIVDYGTRFGVVVDSTTQEAEVQVFEGIVDVEHRALKTPHRLVGGERAVVDADSVDNLRGRERYFADKVDAFANAQIVTTADGRGQEGYVREREPRASIFDTRFVVKASDLGRKNHSKAYLSFDLDSVETNRIQAARFRIQAIPSPRGYASHVPDATFALYGLTDGKDDFWREADLAWETAPGNVDGAGVDQASTTLIGRFQIPQGADSGFFSVDTDRLVEFLNLDTNGIATFILVRETMETEVRGLAHTFARRRTPDAVPPMLFLVPDK